MRKGKSILAIVLIIVVCNFFVACSSNNAIKEKFKQTENGYALSRFEGKSIHKEYTVPDQYDGKPVEELMAFSVSNTEYLEKLNIGKNIKYIDSKAIVNNKFLKEINVDPDNENFVSENGVLYTKDMTTLIAYPNNSHGVTFNAKGDYATFGQFDIPESVQTIGARAFYKCSGIATITLAQSLKIIDDFAFMNCKNLKNITLPSNLEKIGDDAFSFCEQFSGVFYVPKSVVSIGNFALYKNTNITQVHMERESADGMSLGKKWMPIKLKEGSSILTEEVPVLWNKEA